MDYLISAVVGIAISVASWIFAGYFWRFVDYMKGQKNVTYQRQMESITKRTSQ